MLKHIIDTPIGIYRFGWINLELKGKKDKRRRWIAGRFDNVPLAKQYFDCNPFTGKFNFHGNWRLTPIQEFSNFLDNLRTIKHVN